jgi:hypothetical protein
VAAAGVVAELERELGSRWTPLSEREIERASIESATIAMS